MSETHCRHGRKWYRCCDPNANVTPTPPSSPLDPEKALREAHEKHTDCCCTRKLSTDAACIRLTDSINRLARAAWLEPYTRMGLTPEVEPDWLPKETE